MVNLLKYVAILGLSFSLAACLDNEDGFDANAQFEEDLNAIDNYIEENNIDAEIDSSSGIRYAVHTQGNDTIPEAGDTIRVHYEGYLLDGTKFDSSVDRGDPIKFILGAGQVIAGWEFAFSILEEGSEATIFIPSYYAYGRNGSQNGTIPPNTPIFFEVQFLEIINK